MNVDSIRNGVVIDHITPGKGMLVYRFLGLDKLNCPIAIIMNAASRRMGAKDIIKVDTEIPLELDALGYIDPDVTVNIIEEGLLTKKYHPGLPEELVDIVKCKNPRCILNHEQGIPAAEIISASDGSAQCAYCEAHFEA